MIGDEEPLNKFLASVRLFMYVEPIVMEQIAEFADEIQVKAGETLVPSGSDQQYPYVYILRSGRFTVSSPIIGKDRVTISNSGDFLCSLFEVIGIISNVSDKPVFERTIVALEESRVVRIPGMFVRQLGLEKPSEAYNCVRVILTRFQRMVTSNLFSHFGLCRELFAIDQALSAHSASSEEEPSANLSKNILLDTFLRNIRLPEEEWERCYQLVDSERTIKYEQYQEETSIPLEGVFYIISGQVSVKLDGTKESKLMGPSSVICSSLNTFGSKIVSSLTATEDCSVVHLTQAGILKIFEKYPRSYLELAKSIFPLLSPLVAFIDMNLEWLQVTAGSTICLADSKANSMYIVIHGRLCATKEDGSMQVEVGPGESYGESELFQDQNWTSNLYAVRDSELVRVPKDLFDVLTKLNPVASLKMAKILAAKLKNSSQVLDGARKASTIKTIAIIPNSKSSVSLAELLTKKLHIVIRQTDTCIVLTKSYVAAELGKHSFTAFGQLKLIEWLNRQEDSNRIVIYMADSPDSPWTRRCLRQVNVEFNFCFFPSF